MNTKILSLLLIFGLAFASCGNQGGSAGTDPGQAQKEAIEKKNDQTAPIKATQDKKANKLKAITKTTPKTAH